MMNTMFGQMQTQTTSGTCNGLGKIADKILQEPILEGLIKSEEEVLSKSPAEQEDGIQLNVHWKRYDAPFGGIPGDLLVVIEEEQDATIKREAIIYTRTIYFFCRSCFGELLKKLIPSVEKLKLKLMQERNLQNSKIGLEKVYQASILTEKAICLYINVWTPQNSLQNKKSF